MFRSFLRILRLWKCCDVYIFIFSVVYLFCFVILGARIFLANIARQWLFSFKFQSPQGDLVVGLFIFYLFLKFYFLTFSLEALRFLRGTPPPGGGGTVLCDTVRWSSGGVGCPHFTGILWQGGCGLGLCFSVLTIFRIHGGSSASGNYWSEIFDIPLDL